MNTNVDHSSFVADTLQPVLQNDDPIEASLSFMRQHLGMEVAYLSEFVDDDLVFRAVSAPGFEEMVHVGGAMPLNKVFCRHILAGRLPELIPDTGAEPLCQDIDLTHEVPIRSHVSVPIMRADGTPYGMFCCLSRQPQTTLNARDLAVTRAFADISAKQVNEALAIRISKQEMTDVITTIIEDAAFDVVCQPIKTVACQTTKGFEALCRFRGDPYRAPNFWFDDALLVDMQTQLELAVIAKALEALHIIPEHQYLSVNASPDTVSSGRLVDVFAQWPHRRIVLEITEHSVASDYDRLIAEVAKLRNLGIRIAIDDAGAGYSGLQHIVQMKPDIIKLDISLTSSIDTDVVRRSLGSAMVKFGIEVGATIVAEGVESAEELEALHALQVPLAQGYFLDRPAPVETFVGTMLAVN